MTGFFPIRPHQLPGPHTTARFRPKSLESPPSSIGRLVPIAGFLENQLIRGPVRIHHWNPSTKRAGIIWRMPGCGFWQIKQSRLFKPRPRLLDPNQVNPGIQLHPRNRIWGERFPCSLILMPPPAGQAAVDIETRRSCPQLSIIARL